jgi:hypothetical protein
MRHLPWLLLTGTLALGCSRDRPAPADAGPGSGPGPVDATVSLSAAMPAAPDRVASVAPAASPAASLAAVEPPLPAPGTAQPVGCLEQKPQEFLLRRDQIAKPGATAAERRKIHAARARSIDYRTRTYGKFPGFGHHRDNPRPPHACAELTTFMGLPVELHRKVIPALKCVEAALKRECAHVPYQPQRLSGLRKYNTYVDYEVSNHVYGIAIDIDPEHNPCCGCVGRWREHEKCQEDAGSVFDRMVMPECWVHVFERFGFHWLGHDELEDTMHFEFLGDPDRILGPGGVPLDD